jgi:hypothetical protein
MSHQIHIEVLYFLTYQTLLEKSQQNNYNYTLKKPSNKVLNNPTLTLNKISSQLGPCLVSRCG